MTSPERFSVLRPPDSVVEEDEDDVPIGPISYHVRTASVILPCGARVRRQVSLVSMHDESPFEDESSPLLGNGSANTPGSCNPTPPTPPARGLPPWRKSRFETLLQSEALKRYTFIVVKLMSLEF